MKDRGHDDEAKDGRDGEKGDEEHGDDPEDVEGHPMDGCLEALLVDDEDGDDEIGERKKIG